ncbi:hypothetical protein UY3_02623 [Chelonia mydas]|uniref:Myb/SANT-like DNA-binding domain-containing protein n=1 Tax=Chelonia mydas TaxID=8469 RepID=M7BWB7_CHEMY|nr:hypothetical protein UY3_02623 [Chelonia mydas]
MKPYQPKTVSEKYLSSNSITIRGEDAVQPQLHTSRRNFQTCGLTARGMQENEHERDTQQCDAKVKELRQAYQKPREANGHSEAVLKTCHFYKEQHAILGGNPTVPRGKG